MRPSFPALLLAVLGFITSARASDEQMILLAVAQAGDNFGGTQSSLGGPGIGTDGDWAVAGVPFWGPSIGPGGAAGAAAVYWHNGTSWQFYDILLPSSAWSSDFAGWSVAISGDVIVVGVPRDEVGAVANHGTAVVFRRNATTWVEEQILSRTGASTDDFFGRSVAISGDVIVVGAPGADVATVFRYNGVTWNEEQQLTTVQFGNGWFGDSVAVDGDTVAVGAPAAYVGGPPGGGGMAGGLVTIFRWSGSMWAEEDELVILGSSTFGSSVSVRGDRLVVGADGSSVPGSAKVFRRSGTTWIEEQTLSALSMDPQFIDFGVAVSLAADGNTIAVGSASSGAQVGSASIFRWTGAAWEARQVFEDLQPSGFGMSVALNGNRVLIAAPGHDIPFGPGGVGAVYSCGLAWTDLGGGTPGINGVPGLTGSGNLVGGASATVSLTNGPPNAPMLAWVSFSPAPFAALGGTIWAFPFASQLFLFADSNGDFSATTPWPVGFPAGTEVWFQFVLEDLSSLHGLTLSNGVVATTP